MYRPCRRPGDSSAAAGGKCPGDLVCARRLLYALARWALQARGSRSGPQANVACKPATDLPNKALKEEFH